MISDAMWHISCGRMYLFRQRGKGEMWGCGGKFSRHCLGGLEIVAVG